MPPQPRREVPRARTRPGTGGQRGTDGAGDGPPRQQGEGPTRYQAAGKQERQPSGIGHHLGLCVLLALRQPLDGVEPTTLVELGLEFLPRGFGLLRQCFGDGDDKRALIAPGIGERPDREWICT